MNTDRMDTSAVYGLFEELKQSLTEIAFSLEGRSEQQTIDLSKIEELFGKMNTLSKQGGAPEQIRVLEEILTNSVLAGLETVFEKLDGWDSKKKETLQAIEQKLMRWVKRVVLLSVKNMFLVLTLRIVKQLSLFAVWELFFCFLWLETSGKSDKTVNYRIMT